MVLKECLARLKQAKLEPSPFLGGYEPMAKIFQFGLKFGNAMLRVNKFNGKVLNLTLHAPDLEPAAVTKPQRKLKTGQANNKPGAYRGKPLLSRCKHARIMPRNWQVDQD
jgi:hypothetical protein